MPKNILLLLKKGRTPMELIIVAGFGIALFQLLIERVRMKFTGLSVKPKFLHHDKALLLALQKEGKKQWRNLRFDSVDFLKDLDAAAQCVVDPCSCSLSPGQRPPTLPSMDDKLGLLVDELWQAATESQCNA